jgi:hypothetical protein
MVPVVTQVIKYIEYKDQTPGDTYGKPDDVDQAIGYIPPDIAHSNQE